MNKNENPTGSNPNKLSADDMQKWKNDANGCFEDYDTGLYEEVLNGVSMISSPIPCHIRHYKDYFEYKFGDEFADYVIKGSNPEKMKEFDALVDEYNAECEKISKQDKEEYKNKFIKLIFGDIKEEDEIGFINIGPEDNK